jgi:branched-chain amino acid aminotransferase
VHRVHHAIVDGRVVEADRASVPVTDLGLRRGYAVFEFFRVIDRVPVFVDDHLARLERSSDTVGLQLPHDRWALEALVARLIDVNDLEQGAVQILLTGGSSPDGATPATPRLILLPVEVGPPPSAPLAASVITHRHEREFPEAKSTNYLTAMSLASAVREAGATDVVYHDGRLVAEGARSALAIITGATFVTAEAGVLESISMKHVVALAARTMSVRRRRPSLDELFAADEVVTTGSLRGVVPIVSIDGRPVGDGTVGPRARALFEAHRALVWSYVAARRVEHHPPIDRPRRSRDGRGPDRADARSTSDDV